MKKSKVHLLGIIAAAVALTACGKTSGIFSDVQFSTHQQNSDEYLSVATDINSKDVTFTDVTLPIVSNGVTLGTVSLSTDVTTNLSAVVVDFDFTAALKLKNVALSETLPNGTTWPITGVDLSKMFSFDVGTDGSKAYLFADSAAKQLLLGVAINVSSLAIKAPADLLSSFNKNKITGVAGLYLGAAQNTSGLGILVDLGAVTGGKASKIHLKPNTVDAATMSEVYQKLMDLRAAHTPITVH